VFAPETIKILESGCSLVVGTVASDGEPVAGRGWGLTVTDPDGDRVRLVLDKSDIGTRENIEATGRLALTAGDVATLRAWQLKGRVTTAVVDADDAVRAEVVEFCDAFFNNVIATDGTERRLLERLVPFDFVVCEMTVDEVFDQTPGPGAGTAVSREDP